MLKKAHKSDNKNTCDNTHKNKDSKNDGKNGIARFFNTHVI